MNTPRDKVLTVAEWRRVPIEELEFGVRCYNILKRSGVDTLGQLADLHLAEIDGLRGSFGKIATHRDRSEIRQQQVAVRSAILQAEQRAAFACAPDESAGLRDELDHGLGEIDAGGA